MSVRFGAFPARCWTQHYSVCHRRQVGFLDCLMNARFHYILLYYQFFKFFFSLVRTVCSSLSGLFPTSQARSSLPRAPFCPSCHNQMLHWGYLSVPLCSHQETFNPKNSEKFEDNVLHPSTDHCLDRSLWSFRHLQRGNALPTGSCLNQHHSTLPCVCIKMPLQFCWLKRSYWS